MQSDLSSLPHWFQRPGNTGLNYECDAIAACVIGGVSFCEVGTGKIRGVVMGVFILRIIFVALQFLAINQSLQGLLKAFDHPSLHVQSI